MNPNYRRRLALAAQLCLVVATPSCYTSMGKWTYPSGRYKTTASAKPAAAVIAVEPLLDLRSDTNKSYMALSYVPIWPLGWGNFQRPEATIPDLDTTRYRGDIPQDLARSVAIELDRERLVAHAELASDANKVAGATHVLRGKLRSFYVEESRWTYGFSTLAPRCGSWGFPKERRATVFVWISSWWNRRARRSCGKDASSTPTSTSKATITAPSGTVSPGCGNGACAQSWVTSRRRSARSAAPLPPDLASEVRECPRSARRISASTAAARSEVAERVPRAPRAGETPKKNARARVSLGGSGA